MAKILLYSLIAIGKTMTGPAVRYWEFAKALSKRHEVVLMVPNECDLPATEFQIVKKTSDYTKYFKQCDAVIAMSISHSMAWTAKMNSTKLILDAYDPFPLEVLETHKEASIHFRVQVQNEVTNTLNFSFRMADCVLCANENQKDLWTGLLLSQKKITPAIYDQNPSLENRIAIVPFGLPSEPPKKNGLGPRALFNLKPTDTVVLWGGGIWNWFDPLTLIQAIGLIAKKRADIHLVFMAVKPPQGADIADMSMPAKASRLAQDLGLLNKHVFFNPSWMPYEQRANFLLDANIGVSSHFDTLETRYAFRTRILDYLWAGLPILCTEGDSFARLIREKEIGLTVPCQDPEATALALLTLAENPLTVAQMKKKMEAVRDEFHWDHVVKPLETLLASPLARQSKLRSISEILHSVYQSKGVLFPLKVIKDRLFQRLGFANVP